MMFGEYIPFYDQIPWFTEIVPRGVELLPRQRAGARFRCTRRPATSSWARSSATRTSCRRSRAGWPSSGPTPSSTSPTTPGSAAPPSRTSTWRWRCFARSSTGWRWSAPSTPASPRTSTPPGACAPRPSRSILPKSPSVADDLAGRAGHAPGWRPLPHRRRPVRLRLRSGASSPSPSVVRRRRD